MRSILSISLLSLAAVSHGRPSLKPREGSRTLLDDIKQKWNAGGPAAPQISSGAQFAQNNNENNNENQNGNPHQGTPAGTPQDPKHYECIGPMISDFPAVEKWVPFEKLWEVNEDAITTANKKYGNKYSSILKDTISEVADETGVNAELILAMVMQESHGNVEPERTPEGCEYPKCDMGLMQVGYGREFSEADPHGSIKNMIEDGVHGTVAPSGKWTPGVLTYWNAENVGWMVVSTGWQGNPYAAVHIYNDGNIDSLNLTMTDTGVNYYAHDIANRLLGWTGPPDGCEEARACKNLPFGNKPCF